MERTTAIRPCRMDITGKSAGASAAWMGGFFFLRAVYYLGVVNLHDCSGGELIFCAILPMALAAAYFILLKGVRLKVPLVYGALGAVLCLFLLGWSFSLEGTVHRVLGILCSVLGAAGLAGLSLGLLRSRWYGLGPMIAGLVCRVCAYDLPRLSQWKEPAFLVTELSAWCLWGALCALAWSLESCTDQKRENGKRQPPAASETAE